MYCSYIVDYIIYLFKKARQDASDKCRHMIFLVVLVLCGSEQHSVVYCRPGRVSFCDFLHLWPVTGCIHMGAKSCFAGNSKIYSTGPDNDVTEVFRV